jgi:tetratricopeptide (TPR) repeat protein
MMTVSLPARIHQPGLAVLLSIVVVGGWATGPTPALAQAEESGFPSLQGCGDVFSAAFGPFDYTDPADRANLPIVDNAHFTPVVESLERGHSSVYALDDIAYTLRAFPNHHRALNAVARYEIEKGGIPPNSERWLSTQCWFERAMRFRPNDGTVWLIYANFKARQNRNEEALEAYEQAKDLLPGSVEVDYNLGLLYFKLGQYEKAASHAKIAYGSGYPLQGLKRKLAGKGYDVDR